MASTDDFKSWVRRSGAPGTVGIIAALVLVSFYCWFLRGSGPALLQVLVFTNDWYHRPWTILTYPFAVASLGPAFLFFVIECLWIFWTGGSVERDLGTPRFLGVWFAAAALAALVMWGVAQALGLPLVLDGPSLAVAAVTVLWGVRNPNLTVLLFFIIPVKAIWIAWGTIGLTLFGFGEAHPMLGVAACVHLAVAYLFALNRLPGLSYSRPIAMAKPSKAQREKEERLMDDVRRRRQEREERERLRKLFESSLDEDEK